MKFCKDCKWFEPVDKNYETCGYPGQPMVEVGNYLVSGESQKMIRRWRHCSTQRKSESRLACGPNGKWFEKSANSRAAV